MDKPNILFIMDDQHRFDYLGAAGASFVNTPNLDRLAANGTRFTQCSTNAPVCAPARIGLATGLQPFRVGSLDNWSFLPQSATTYYQRLRDHGYRVGCVGKLDLGKPDRYNGRHGDRPSTYSWGFTHPEECEGKMHAKTPTPLGPYTHHLQERGLLKTFFEDYTQRAKAGWVKGYDDSVLSSEDFEDGYIGRRSAEWIETIPDDFPWHLFVSFVGPHDPFDPPTEYADRYRDTDMPAAIPPSPEGKPLGRRCDLEPAEVADTRRQYCALIELIDDQIGMMLDALERRGMMENTVIIFSSDHGEMLGDHGLYTKSAPYEAAMRVPLIISGPGLPKGAVSDAIVELIDINPTICEVAGLLPQERIDAKSIMPTLRGETQVHRTDALSCLKGFDCLRTPEWKLITRCDGGVELYNLAEDPEERVDVAKKRPEVLDQMLKRLRERRIEDGGAR